VPLLAALTTGIVSYSKAGQTTRVAVGSGFFEFADDRAVLITDRFIQKDDVDPVRVRLDLKEADEAIEKFQGDPKDPAYAELVQKELWAAIQLELYGDPPPPRVRTLSELELNMVEDYRALAKKEVADDEAGSEAEGSASKE